MDGHSSCQALQVPGRHETAWPITGTRSCAKVAGLELGAFAFYTTMHGLEWKATHDDTKPWRVAGYVTLPIIAAAIHVSAAVHNYELAPAPVVAPSASCREDRDGDRCVHD